MADYWGGLVEGFSGARNKAVENKQALDAQRRAQEAEIYKHLLTSRDPKISSLALAGLFESAQPGTKRKGLSGFMGEMESSKMLPQIQAAMEEMVPDATGAPAAGPPARPGSAAMPAGSLVTPDKPSSPQVQAPGPMGDAAPTLDMAMQNLQGPPNQAQALPQGPPAAPAAPPEHPMHRRGTGIPTAEEVADLTMRAQIRAKQQETVLGLQAAGATPEEIQDALMGIAGAPRPQRSLTAESQWGVQLTPDGPIQPVFLAQPRGTDPGGYKLAGGAPLPQGSKMVRMSGGGAGGGLTTTVKDSPQVRAQYGIDPTEVNPAGYWKIKQVGDSVQVMPTTFIPPPAFAGTADISIEGVPTRVAIPRSGGPTVPIGPTPATGPTQSEGDATALLKEVDQLIADAGKGPAGMKKKLLPNQRDQITKDAATRAKLPFTTYYELQKAAQHVTPAAKAAAPKPDTTTMADRIRARVLQNRGGPPLVAPPPSR